MLSRNFSKVLKSFSRFTVASSNVARQNYCKSSQNDDDGQDSNLKLGGIGSKYQVFRDQDSEIILDVYEERLKYQEGIREEIQQKDIFEDINLERGITGVFDIEDLVSLMKRDNAEDIFVVSVPTEIKYVDYMCFVTGKSQRHMLALAEFTRRVFKKKKHKSDSLPKIEGEKSKDWIALDLGNIALHIFSREAREYYDLETLWTVGPKFDIELKKQDPVVELLEKHSVYLKDLQPAN